METSSTEAIKALKIVAIGPDDDHDAVVSDFLKRDDIPKNWHIGILKYVCETCDDLVSPEEAKKLWEQYKPQLVPLIEESFDSQKFGRLRELGACAAGMLHKLLRLITDR